MWSLGAASGPWPAARRKQGPQLSAQPPVENVAPPASRLLPGETPNSGAWNSDP